MRVDIEAVWAMLKTQYHAALTMLHECVRPVARL